MAFLSINQSRRQPSKLSVLIKDTTCDQKYKKRFYSWTTLGELKRYIEGKNGVKPGKQRLFLGLCELRGKHMTLEHLLEDDKKDAVELILRFREEFRHEPYIRPFLDSLMKLDRIRAVIAGVNKAFQMGLVPQAVKFGVSGSYFLRGANKANVAIFKPLDEEPYAPNNPKGYVGKFGDKSMREGILSGEGAAREVAAFMLDSKRVHKVPETFFAELYHPYFQTSQSSNKLDSSGVGLESVMPLNPREIKDGVKYGSLQFLKDNDGESCDFSSRRFPVE